MYRIYCYNERSFVFIFPLRLRGRTHCTVEFIGKKGAKGRYKIKKHAIPRGAHRIIRPTILTLGMS